MALYFKGYVLLGLLSNVFAHSHRPSIIDECRRDQCSPCEKLILEKLDHVKPAKRDHPKTCAHVIGKLHALQVIDPDGPKGMDPFKAVCDFATIPATTILHHEKEGRKNVGIACEAYGCAVVKIGYYNTMEQIKAVIAASGHCRQYLKYECKGSQISKFAWWVSHDNHKATYWAGGKPTGFGCACGLSHTCANATKVCNCDKNDGVWREDSGTITDKTQLPVIRLQFGDLGHKGEEGYYTLGSLRCFG